MITIVQATLNGRKRTNTTIDKDYAVILSGFILPLSNVDIECSLKCKTVPMSLLTGVDDKIVKALGKLYPMLLVNMYTYRVFELLFGINNIDNTTLYYTPGEIVKEIFDITKTSLNFKEIKSTAEHTKLQKELSKPLNWNIVSKMIECSDCCSYIIVNQYDQSKVLYNPEYFNRDNKYIIFNYAVDDMTLMYVNL